MENMDGGLGISIMTDILILLLQIVLGLVGCGLLVIAFYFIAKDD